MNKDWKHRPGLDPETIADIIREGREENDKKFETYAEYASYMVKKNQEILDKLGSDYDHNGIPYWNNKVHIVENFISAEECNELIKYFDKRSFPGPDPLVKFVSIANESVYFDMKNDNEYPDINQSVHNTLDRIQEILSDTYDLPVEVSSSNYVDMSKGSSLPEHTDMGGSSDPVNHTRIDDDDKFEFSALVYLNDDFEGGYLNFPKEGFKVKTKPGSLVYFNGTTELFHEVTEILEGNRKNIASFYKRKK